MLIKLVFSPNAMERLLLAPREPLKQPEGTTDTNKPDSCIAYKDECIYDKP